MRLLTLVRIFPGLRWFYAQVATRFENPLKCVEIGNQLM